MLIVRAILELASVEVIQGLYEAGADINFRDKHNRTPVSRVVLAVDFPVIKYLIC